MNRIKSRLLEYTPYIGLYVLVFAIFASNYKPGTFLIGWDSLQNELNAWINVKRAVFSVWQEYQSFGLVSGMAHATDFIRALFIWVLSFFLDAEVIRYFYHHLMLLVGGIGVFTFLKKAFSVSGPKLLMPFIGACFYIVNLGTVQIFALPFEPFSTFFAFLPWEIYTLYAFVTSERSDFSKQLFWLILINMLATPQSYLQTLFVVYFVFVTFFSIGLLLSSPDKRKVFKRLVISAIAIGIVNLFWILPQVYFIKTNLSVVKESKINQLATEIVFNQNLEKGNVVDFIRLEGFYYDLFDVYRQQIFSQWHIHFDNPVFNLLPYLVFATAFLGLFRRSRLHVSFLMCLFAVAVVLLPDTFGFSYLNSILRENSFLGQIFRSSFTKFIVPYVFIYTYFFAAGFDKLHELLLKVNIPTIKNLMGLVTNYYLLGVAYLALLVLYSFPSFNGAYFASQMRVKLPTEYSEVMNYFNSTDPNKRIALLPEYTFWGWFKYFWGYEGSGFLWYGVEQPIVSRTFDVWSFNSESYFWEMKDAIERIDVVAFENTLEKYSIDYLLLDDTAFAVSSTQESLQRDQLEEIRQETSKLSTLFQSRTMGLYSVAHADKSQTFSTLSKDLPNIGPDVKVTNRDNVYSDVGAYKTYSVSAPDYYYPFLDLMSQTRLTSKKWEIIEEPDVFVFKADLSDLDLSEYEFPQSDVSLDANIFVDEEFIQLTQDVDIKLFGKSIVVRVKKVLVEDFDLSTAQPVQCSKFGGDLFADFNETGALAITTTDRGVGCFGYEEQLLAHWNGYLINVEPYNEYGRELFFYVVGNKNRKQSKVEEYLHDGDNYFVLPTGNYYDDGYAFSFQNQSYTYTDSKNVLRDLQVYLMPYEYIKDIKLVRKGLLKPSEGSQADFFTSAEVNKLNYYTYTVENISAPYSNFLLYQSFDEGWKAYIHKNPTKWQYIFPFLGEKVEDHFIVNNWANGWKVRDLGDGEVLVVTFWPQWLQYVGFGVFWVFAVVATLFGIILNLKHRSITNP